MNGHGPSSVTLDADNDTLAMELDGAAVVLGWLLNDSDLVLHPLRNGTSLGNISVINLASTRLLRQPLDGVAVLTVGYKLICPCDQLAAAHFLDIVLPHDLGISKLLKAKQVGLSNRACIHLVEHFINHRTICVRDVLLFHPSTVLLGVAVEVLLGFQQLGGEADLLHRIVLSGDATLSPEGSGEPQVHGQWVVYAIQVEPECTQFGTKHQGVVAILRSQLSTD